MSYEVFARKYRPQTFDDLVGQAHVSRTLKNAVAQNRLAHAYLFVGPRGVGKTSTARILAKSLNCVKGPTVTPCGECDNCREIAAGNSLDVIEIDGASDNRAAESFTNNTEPLPAVRSPSYPSEPDRAAPPIHRRKRKNYAGARGGACDCARSGRRPARCGINARSVGRVLRRENQRERRA